MTYSPPGYLTFFEAVKTILLNYHNTTINSNPLIPSWQVSPWEDTFLIFDLNNDNASIIRKLLDTPPNVKDMEFYLERIIVEPSGYITQTQDCLYYLDYDNNIYTFIENMFTEQEKEVTYTKQELEQFCHITNIWKIIRDLLCSEGMEQWILTHDHQKTLFSKEKWIKNEHWYHLVCSNKSRNNEPFFIEGKIVEKITLELIKATQNYNKVASEFAQKVLKEEIKPRASVQLLLHILTNYHTVFTNQWGVSRKVAESNKNDFTAFILLKAKECGFITVKPQEQKKFDEEKSISEKDADAIATLIRSLGQQRR